MVVIGIIRVRLARVLCFGRYGDGVSARGSLRSRVVIVLCQSEKPLRLFLAMVVIFRSHMSQNKEGKEIECVNAPASDRPEPQTRHHYHHH